ncbi:MAG TPA: VOC family protein, partial [Xanthomonadaceae bacterium]|nr:VOC family protein [Xanthomonadaceae bacterium]
VHGIGGVFFKSRDPAALAQWYRDKLGFDVQEWGGAAFVWDRVDTGERAYTVWGPFRDDTEYFQPSDRPYMVNLRVDDLDAMLAALRADGVQVLDRREDTENGRFGYALDPDGTLLELWQPAAEDPSLDDSDAAGA